MYRFIAFFLLILGVASAIPIPGGGAFLQGPGGSMLVEAHGYLWPYIYPDIPSIPRLPEELDIRENDVVVACAEPERGQYNSD